MSKSQQKRLATQRGTPATDAQLGMTWWNAISAAERVRWMREAGDTGVAADAWEAFMREMARCENRERPEHE